MDGSIYAATGIAWIVVLGMHVAICKVCASIESNNEKQGAHNDSLLLAYLLLAMLNCNNLGSGIRCDHYCRIQG